MATINFASSTNNINGVMWSYSTQIDVLTDRESGSFAPHALILSIANLGVGVTSTSPFTLLS